MNQRYLLVAADCKFANYAFIGD